MLKKRSLFNKLSKLEKRALATDQLYCDKCLELVQPIAPADDLGTTFYRCVNNHQTTKPINGTRRNELDALRKQSNKTHHAAEPIKLARLNDIENPAYADKPVVVIANVSSNSISYQVPAPK